MHADYGDGGGMFCVHCGSAVPGDGRFCANCGAPVTGATSSVATDPFPTAAAPQFYAPLMRWDGQPLAPDFASKKVAAGICGILLGYLGIHKFILGYTSQGVIMLVITLVSIPLCLVVIGAFGLAAMSIIGFIEGIIYLTKSDQDFIFAYGLNQRGWF